MSIKKIIELALAGTAVLLLVVDDSYRLGGSEEICVLTIALIYLAVVVLMACLSRDVGASPAMEGSTGVLLTAYSMSRFFREGFRTSDYPLLIARICEAVLGIMLMIFLLF